MLMKYYPTEPGKFLRQEVNHQEQKSEIRIFKCSKGIGEY
jgi:hypothetical protein